MDHVVKREKIQKLITLVKELELHKASDFANIIICEGMVFTSADGRHWGTDDDINLTKNDNNTWTASADSVSCFPSSHTNKSPSLAVAGLKHSIIISTVHLKKE